MQDFLREGGPVVKRPRALLRLIWEDNIKTDVKEMGVDWTGVVWFRMVTSGGPLGT
jgi:hypothetical protein